MQDFGLDAGKAEDREKFKSIIYDIVTNRDEVRTGKWYKYDSTFYRKGEDVVVVNSNDKKFRTVLKGGAENERFKAAK